jgi:anti-anti-sigma factor
MLTVTAQVQGDVLILQCQGRIIRGEETAILCSAARQPTRTIVLDLAEVETIDAAGIGALVSLQAAGFYLKLTNPTAPVREILRLTKLNSIFEVSPGLPVSEAVEADTPKVSEHACQASAS